MPKTIPFFRDTLSVDQGLPGLLQPNGGDTLVLGARLVTLSGLAPGFNYVIVADQLTVSAGAALTWLPTTGEFGPRGAFGDYEQHEELATRFNLAYTYSPEDRQTPIGTPAANTTLRLADSLNIFDTVPWPMA